MVGIAPSVSESSPRALELVRAGIVKRRPLGRGKRVVGGLQTGIGALGGDEAGGGVGGLDRLGRGHVGAAVGVATQRVGQRAVRQVRAGAHDDLQERGVDPPQQRRDPFRVGRVGLLHALDDQRAARAALGATMSRSSSASPWAMRCVRAGG